MQKSHIAGSLAKILIFLKLASKRKCLVSVVHWIYVLESQQINGTIHDTRDHVQSHVIEVIESAEEEVIQG